MRGLISLLRRAFLRSTFGSYVPCQLFTWVRKRRGKLTVWHLNRMEVFCLLWFWVWWWLQCTLQIVTELWCTVGCTSCSLGERESEREIVETITGRKWTQAHYWYICLTRKSCFCAVKNQEMFARLFQKLWSQILYTVQTKTGVDI